MLVDRENYGLQTVYSSSRINTHLMFSLTENKKYFTNCFSGKKTFKNCNPDFTFYHSKLTNKNFPVWCNVKFSLLFCILYCSKTDLKLTLHHMSHLMTKPTK